MNQPYAIQPRFLPACFVLAVSLSVATHAAENPPSSSGMAIVAKHQAVFDRPAGKIPSDCSVDAPLMGNGDTLVAMGGNASALQFYVGKNELWKMSHDCGTKPVALARLDLLFPEMAGATYRVEQDLATAITTGRFTKDGWVLTLETGVAATENLLWTKLSVTGEALHGSARLLPAGTTHATLADPGGVAHGGREMYGNGRWYFDGEIAGLRVVPDVLPGSVVGKPENPQSFDGKTTKQELTVPKMNRTVSVAAWIKPRSISAQGNYIVSKGEWCKGYSLGLSNGRLRFAIGPAFEQTVEPLALDTWHYVVGAFDGTALRVYVNGKQLAGPPPDSATDAISKVQVVQRHFKVGDPLPFRGKLPSVTIPAGAACATRVIGAEPDFTLTPGTPVWIVTTVTGLHGDGEAYPEMAIKRAEAIVHNDMTRILSDHIAWWRTFWNRSFVQIPDKQLEQRYYLSHYGMASCSRVPDFPPGIFGWVTTDNPAWSGDYHMNYNFVSPFYGLYAANHLEQAATCNEPIIASHKASLQIAKAETGVEGTYHYVGLGPKGSIAHRIGLGQKSNSSYSCVPLAQYWYATYDKDYGKRAYPFVRDTALFWENYLKFENGRYVIYKDAVHEGSGDNINPIVSLAFVKMVMNLALDMSTELGADADRHAKWKHILAHLSAYPTMNQEKTGKPIFRYTETGTAWWSDNTVGIQHIYPVGGIGLDSPPELLERSHHMIDAMERWIDFNGMNSFYPAAARVGYNPETILAKMKNMLARIGGPNGMVPNNPHGVELFSIVPNTIQEMLMQSHEGVIRLFPCWPRDQDATFGTLRAYGAFLVSAELKSGTVGGVRIVSEKGRDCVVRNPWPGKTVWVTRNGKTETASGERFTLKTTAGETLNLKPEL